jgi:hypothetical protein
MERGGEGRHGRLQRSAPNTNLLYPRAVVPQLIGSHGSGIVDLSCAVLASPDPDMARIAWGLPPHVALHAA